MPKFSCFVVGKGVVALKCLEILVQAHIVIGVYSNDGSLKAWADEHSIVHAPSQKAFHKLLKSYEYDYLFSINNGWIIPQEVIAHARRTTINYHNSPLPKYAGLHATSWALIHGETQHAISWHEVVPEIDAGRIFKQPTIPIQPQDTALSLNTRCFEVAVSAFDELVSELATSQAQSLAQDLSFRSYFGQSDRPEAACLLAFDRSTTTLYNLVRGLDFGPTHNPLGLPKLWLPKGVVAVGSARPVYRHDRQHPCGDACPGQVLSLDEDGLCVATADGALLLSRITTLEGKPVGALVLKEHYGVRLGAVLPALKAEMRHAISERNAAICRHERTWVQHLAQLSPFVHPYLQGETYHATDNGYQRRYPIALPANEIDGRSGFTRSGLPPRSLLAMFAAYCVRLSTEPAFDLTLQTERSRSVAPEIFAQHVPIRVQTDDNEPFKRFRERFDATLECTANRGSYALDVVARHPELRLRNVSNALPIALVLAQTPESLKESHLDSAMALIAYEDGSPPELACALNPVYSEALVRQLQSVIAACIQNPEQPVHLLPLLSAQERQQILVEWNRTAKPYPSDRCIHELVSEQAARTPNALAVRCGDLTLSYQELERRSNQLARWLQQQGIKPDGLVALCVPRSVEMIVGLLGILKAGGAYVPIDPTYPAERIAYLIDHSCPQAVVTVASLGNTLFDGFPNVVCLDEHAPILAKFEPEPVETEVTPEHLAYVIYTSGSTGKPKGVEIRHRSLINHSWAIADNYGLGLGDRVLLSASISFDVAGEQIYPALFRGASVVVRPDDLLESFERFSKFVESQAITVLILPTAFWHEWVVELLSFGQTVPRSLRVLSVGTERVLGNRLEQWQYVSEGRVAFFQGYGPTEAAVTCTMYSHDGRPFDRYAAVPIGRPLPNTEIYILDQHLEPVPVGIVGRLYVGGDGLFRSYHQQPDLTAQSFIPHPFRTTGDARLYDTGDFARFLADGQIVYCDRTDHQIKLHGFRIELGEIEAALGKYQGVKQAVVHPYEATPESRSLVAYVVPNPDHSLILDDLQRFLKAKLPHYMLPSTIVLMDALPLTPNGKVNRQVLPKPNPNYGAPATDVAEAWKRGKSPSRVLRDLSLGLSGLIDGWAIYSTFLLPPRDRLECQLMRIWETVLGIQPTSIHDNFFDLGGSSLKAVRLADQIQKIFNSNLPLAAIFQAPTIALLAQTLRQEIKGEKSSWSSLVAIQSNGNRLPLFLFQGIELYHTLASHLDPDQPVYGLALEMVDETKIFFKRIEELAAHYIQQMRAVQPNGPYLLGGLSFGGMVALEVAQQLQAEGQEVGLLALFDTAAPGAYTLKPLRSRILGHLNNVSKFGSTYIVKKLARVFHRIHFKLAQRLRLCASNTKQYKFVQAAYEQIVLNYQPQVYSGRVVLFLATNRSAIYDSVCDPALVDIDPQFGWGNLVAGRLDIYEIPGDHLSILQEPQVRILAEKLQACLNEDC